MMAVAFSSNDIAAVNRKLDLKEIPQPTSKKQIKDAYEISRCAKWINNKGFEKVVLQFPDTMLVDSGAVELALKNEVVNNVTFFTAADNSYESCCIDETAIQKVNAEAIIHFGHACLSSTCRFPVLYIYVNQPLDITNAVKEFKRLFPDTNSNIIVLFEVVYAHAVDDLINQLKNDYENLIPSKLHLLSDDIDNNEEFEINEALCRITKFGRYFVISKSCKLEDCNIFFIGSDNRRLISFMMSFNQCRFFSYDPRNGTGRHESLDVNRCLRKRYYYIERAKDAKRVAILVRHSSSFHCRDIIKHLKAVIKSCNKKDYVVSITTLNCAKLANYTEADVFVYVACPETVLVDCHDFYQPIITPFELEVACNQSREWTGDYILDFSEILPGAVHHIPTNPRLDADVSLITGSVRTMGCGSESEEISSDTSLTVRGSMTVAALHSGGAGEYLANRSWQGLEQCLGETPVAEIVQGKKGIASEYEGEG